MFQSKILNDFYPTPKHCIIEAKEYILEANNILEATAGLGFVSVAMKEINPKAKIDSLEYDTNTVKVGKTLTENALNIKEGNFFNMPNKTNYDHIFLNPPFTSGYSKKDKYYVKFVLKLLLMLDETASNNKRKEVSAQLLVPPSLFNLNNVKKGDMIYLGDFLSKVPKTELNRYLKELNIDKDEVENFSEVNCQFLGFCKFDTTKFNVANFILTMKYQ